MNPLHESYGLLHVQNIVVFTSLDKTVLYTHIFSSYLHIYCTNFPNNLFKFEGYCSFLGEFLTHFFLDCPTKIRDLYSVLSRRYSSALGKLMVTRQHHNKQVKRNK